MATTTGLDPRSRLALWDVLRELSDQGVTILLTTQHRDEADHLADRIAMIDAGRVVAEGTVPELKRRVGAERVHFGFADESDFARAEQAVGGAIPGPERLTLAVGTDRASVAIKQTLDVLARQPTPIEIASIEIERPSLDDVFLTLTGRSRPAARHDVAA